MYYKGWTIYNKNDEWTAIYRGVWINTNSEAGIKRMTLKCILSINIL